VVRNTVTGIVGVLAVSLLAVAGTAAAPAATATASARVASPLLSETFTRTDGLVTNEYAHWNPRRGDRVTSPTWDMTSGSLFTQGGVGYSGRTDRTSPNVRSTNATDSAVFRLNTRRADFGDVRIASRLNVQRLASTSSTPAVAWDGVHIWLRYQSQYNLYYASVARRDGRVVIKKKCPGGPSNDGTYYSLSKEVPGFPIPYGEWRDVGATVRNNRDGTVAISLTLRGRAVVTATDQGVGCAPITRAGAVGIRGDNAEFRFDDFTVSRL
jgi:hypothetical protein